MTRVAWALIGLIAGMFLFAIGVFVAAWTGWTAFGVAIAVLGIVMAVGFLLLYDVDPPSEAGVP